ncbi:Uma2 family endonuclease [Breznakiellaceae bacterium SP9]
MADAAAVDYYKGNSRKTDYTYADYLELKTDKRYELMNGVYYLMASPSERHQRISMELSMRFATFLYGKPCRVYAAPFDVRLHPKKNRTDRTVLQPDLLVVCDRAKISHGSCDGAPDLVIEILSPSNTEEEMAKKYTYYRSASVREYWVVDPALKQVKVCLLEAGAYKEQVYEGDCRIPVTILPGLSIDSTPLWEE